MLIHAFPDKRNVRRQRHITRSFLPNKLKSVRCRPHILAAARYRIAPLGYVVFRGPRVPHSAYVSVAFEQSTRCIRRPIRRLRPRAVLCGKCQHQRTTQDHQPSKSLSFHGKLLHSPKRSQTLGCRSSIVNSPLTPSSLCSTHISCSPFSDLLLFPFSSLACYLRHRRGNFHVRQQSDSRRPSGP